jgi:cystathionine beta-lyase
MWLDATPLLEKLPRGSDPATFFLEKAKVALSDGRDFSGPGHVRLNFGKSTRMSIEPG